MLPCATGIIGIGGGGCLSALAAFILSDFGNIFSSIFSEISSVIASIICTSLSDIVCGNLEGLSAEFGTASGKLVLGCVDVMNNVCISPSE
jgi:hypothetical protein